MIGDFVRFLESKGLIAVLPDFNIGPIREFGEEYKELRTDSKEFMEKSTTVMGEDLKVSSINSESITEKLADIDRLRSEIRTLTQEKELLANTLAKEKEQPKEKSEQQTA